MAGPAAALVALGAVSCVVNATDWETGALCDARVSGGLSLNVFGGTPLVGAAPLAERQAGAIVAIEVLLQDQEPGLCSGVFIGERSVLTAKHCVEPACSTGEVCAADGGTEAVADRLVVHGHCRAQVPLAAWLHPQLERQTA